MAKECDEPGMIKDKDGQQGQVKIISSSVPYILSHGEQRARYYHPFPRLNAYPLTIKLKGTGPATITYRVSAR